MRIAFLLALLAGGVYYAYVAFVDLDFLTRRGRLGPGFFPRIVGVSIVVLTIWSLVDALKVARNRTDDPGSWRDVALLMGLAITFAVSLRLFGGFVATVIYLALALSLLNPGKHVQNALLCVIVPIAIYLLFDRLLNASMPSALFNILPI